MGKDDRCVNFEKLELSCISCEDQCWEKAIEVIGAEMISERFSAPVPGSVQAWSESISARSPVSDGDPTPWKRPRDA